METQRTYKLPNNKSYVNLYEEHTITEKKKNDPIEQKSLDLQA